MTLFCIPENRKSVFKGAAVSHVSIYIHIHNRTEKERNCVRCGDGSTTLSKCLSRPPGDRQPQFLLLFGGLTAAGTLELYFLELHSSNRASLPLLTHNVLRTSRNKCFFSPSFLNADYYHSFSFYLFEVPFVCGVSTSAAPKNTTK